MTAETRYSTAGPECPYCGHGETPDEPYYYNDSTQRLECSGCEREYAVEVDHTTSWTTRPLEELRP